MSNHYKSVSILKNSHPKINKPYALIMTIWYAYTIAFTKVKRVAVNEKKGLEEFI